MNKKIGKVQVTVAITQWQDSYLSDIFVNPDEVQILNAVEYEGALYLIYLYDAEYEEYQEGVLK